MDIIGKKSIRIGKSLKGKSNIDSNVRIPRERERERGRGRETEVEGEREREREKEHRLLQGLLQFGF